MKAGFHFQAVTHQLQEQLFLTINLHKSIGDFNFDTTSCASSTLGFKLGHRLIRGPSLIPIQELIWMNIRALQ
jgi:hypothetical protein